MDKRFMVDDAGTLIDMQTRDMFDIVEEVCPLLNGQHEQIQELQQKNEWLIDRISELITQMSELGFSIELEDKDGNTIDLTGDVE